MFVTGKGRPIPRRALAARSLHIRSMRLSSFPNNPIYKTRLDRPCDSPPLTEYLTIVAWKVSNRLLTSTHIWRPSTFSVSLRDLNTFNETGFKESLVKCSRRFWSPGIIKVHIETSCFVSKLSTKFSWNPSSHESP